MGTLAYQKHVFFCTNQREDRAACGNKGCGEHARSYVKKRVKELRFDGSKRIRINAAGCLGRCLEGPLCVIYPEGVWYRFQNDQDLEEIITQHLINGSIVQRLRI